MSFHGFPCVSPSLKILDVGVRLPGAPGSSPCSRKDRRSDILCPPWLVNFEPFPLVVDGGMSLAGSSGWMIRNTDECSLFRFLFLLSYLGGGISPSHCGTWWHSCARQISGQSECTDLSLCTFPTWQWAPQNPPNSTGSASSLSENGAHPHIQWSTVRSTTLSDPFKLH